MKRAVFTSIALVGAMVLCGIGPGALISRPFGYRRPAHAFARWGFA